MILVAVGAGPEAEEEARRRWEDEKPDEYFFLEVFGSAVVEHLTTMTGAGSATGLNAVRWLSCPTTAPVTLNGTSRAASAARVTKWRTAASAFRVEVLESGMLSPKKTLLAVFGLTRHTERFAGSPSWSPARIVPSHLASTGARLSGGPAGEGQEMPDRIILDYEAQYSVNTKR